MPELSKELHKELNVQIQEETFSAWLYYAMSAWFESNGLVGFAHWMRIQAMEEVTHTHRFYKHIIERNATVDLYDIAKPQGTWESPLDAAMAAYKHEQHITGRIHKLMTIARKDNDFTAEIGVLNWFIDEQIEEEENTSNMVTQLEMIGDDKAGLYQLDKQYATRIFALEPDFTW